MSDVNLMELVDEVHRLRNENEALRRATHQHADQTEELLGFKNAGINYKDFFKRIEVRMTAADVLTLQKGDLIAEAARQMVNNLTRMHPVHSIESDFGDVVYYFWVAVMP